MHLKIFTKNNIRFIMYIAVVCCMVYIFSFLFHSHKEDNIWYDGFGKDSDIKINHTLYRHKDIQKYTFKAVKKNDILEIKTKLPKDIISTSTFIIRSWHSSLDVFIDGNKIYSYGEKRFKNKDMMGSGYHFVNVLPMHSNKTITVRMHVAINNAFKNIEFFKLCKKNNSVYYLFYPDALSIYVSLFMILFGIIGCICSLFFLKDPLFSNKYIFYVFMTSFLAGLWINCGSGFFHFISNNYEVGNFLEFFSLYLVVFSYFLAILKIKNINIKNKFINFVELLYVFFLICAFSMHFLRIVYLPSLLPIMHFFMVLVMIAILYTLTKNYSNQKKYEKILLWGNVGSIVLALVQLIIFNFDFYFGNFFINSFNKSFFIIIAFLIMIISLFVSYTVKLYEIRNFEREVDILKQYAYKDNLTNLSNRKTGIDFLSNLTKNKVNYTIIMFDLNDLKKANDNYGHERGDILLRDFSDCIRMVFPNERCEKIRYGGDEFLVILREYKDKEIKRYLAKLNKIIDKKNENSKDDIVISAAYGIAKNTEVKNNDYKEVINVADRRMYEHKKIMKSMR